jgi:uncharacterized membrane protein
MYRDEVRLRSLEQRVDDLETRLLEVEHRVEPARASASPERSTLASRTEAAALPSTQADAGATAAPRAAAGGVPVPPPAPATGPHTVPAWTTAAAARPPSTPDRASGAGPRWTTPAPEPTPPTPADSHRLAWRPPVGAGPSPAFSLRDLEERFAGRALAWIGGLALIGAAVFFLSLAFSRGWINEPLRVAIGLVGGGLAFGAGAWFLARRNQLMGNVLAAVGLGIISIALLAATRLYDLLPPEVGLAGALVAAMAAAAIAIRYDARIVAAFGLIAALASPPLVGASPTVITLAFVAVTLVGTTVIALFRSWRWLPPLAFVLSAPQLASWLNGDPDVPQAMVALAGFWLINVVAAAGEEVRVRRDDLRPSSATLVLADAVFLLWGGFAVLSGDLGPWRGTFIALASLAHLAVGVWFLRRQGLEHLFGNLVAGTGVALLALAAFVQLGAPAVPVAWSAEAVALAWLAVRRMHRWSALAALVLGCLAVGHLVTVEFPLSHAGIPPIVSLDTPLPNPELGSLAAVLLAISVAVLVVPVRWIRSALIGVGVLLTAYAATFEVAGPALAAVLAAVTLGGLMLDQEIGRLPVLPELERRTAWIEVRWIASLATIVSGGMAVWLMFATEYPIGASVSSATPFLHPEAASLAIVLLMLAGAGAVVGVRWVRSSLAGVGVLLLAWALHAELNEIARIATLAVLLPLGVLTDRGLARLREDQRFAAAARAVPFAGFASAAGAVSWLWAVTFAQEEFLRLADWGKATPPPVTFGDERALVAALLAGSALAAARWLGDARARRAAVLAAVVVGAWVAPFEVFADGVVVLWVALAVAAALAYRVDPAGDVAWTAPAIALFSGATLVAFGIVAPPDRLVVVETGLQPLLAGWPVAFIALAAALYAAPRHPPLAPWRTWLELASGVVAVYALSVGVVDVFQGQVGGPIAVTELATQAQVALSVCWTSIGAAALLVGFARQHPLLRHAGLGLLGMATIKVFLVDLASMDVAYRAVVLAGVGVLLLLSAWLFTHFRGPRAGAAGLHGGERPVG